MGTCQVGVEGSCVAWSECGTGWCGVWFLWGWSSWGGMEWSGGSEEGVVGWIQEGGESWEWVAELVGLGKWGRPWSFAVS
jgi:hypothetical protein